MAVYVRTAVDVVSCTPFAGDCTVGAPTFSVSPDAPASPETAADDAGEVGVGVVPHATATAKSAEPKMAFHFNCFIRIFSVKNRRGILHDIANLIGGPVRAV
jgi:hypothetical protein